MEIITHHLPDLQIAEPVMGKTYIDSAQVSLDLLADLYYQGFHAVILHDKDISSRFFDLKTGFAGEIVQKYSNYRMRLAIVGDFTIYGSKSLHDFMRESNQTGSVIFVNSVEEALEKWKMES